MPLAQPQAIRTIFFDAGFTLIRTSPSDAEICQQVCQQLNLHLDVEQVNQKIALADDYYYRQTRLNRHLWANEQAIHVFWIAYYMSRLRPLVIDHDEHGLYPLT